MSWCYSNNPGRNNSCNGNVTAEKHKAMPITARNPLPAPQQDEDASTFTKTFCRMFTKIFAQNILQNICTVNQVLFPPAKYPLLPLSDAATERWDIIQGIKGETFRMADSRSYVQPKEFSQSNVTIWSPHHMTCVSIAFLFCCPDLSSASTTRSKTKISIWI